MLLEYSKLLGPRGSDMFTIFFTGVSVCLIDVFKADLTTADKISLELSRTFAAT
jgi:hypothetical protein